MTANNINLIGSNVEIIVDFFDDIEGYYVCRTAQNSPDVDFYVLLDHTEKVEEGNIYKVKLKDYIFGFFKGEVL